MRVSWLIHHAPHLTHRAPLPYPDIEGLVDEHTIGVVCILGNHYAGQYDPVEAVGIELEKINKKHGWQVRRSIKAMQSTILWLSRLGWSCSGAVWPCGDYGHRAREDQQKARAAGAITMSSTDHTYSEEDARAAGARVAVTTCNQPSAPPHTINTRPRSPTPSGSVLRNCYFAARPECHAKPYYPPPSPGGRVSVVW